MKLLVLSDKMRDIIVFGEKYKIQELKEAYQEVSDFNFKDNPQMYKITEDIRDEFMRVIGSIIENYRVWRTQLIELVKSQEKAMKEINQILDGKVEYKLENQEFRQLPLNQKIKNSSHIIVRWQKLIEAKNDFGKIIDHFDDIKINLMVSIEEERDLFSQLSCHIDTWITKYNMVRECKLSDLDELVQIQELMDEVANKSLFKFPELEEVFKYYKEKLNLFIQFDHFMNNRVTLKDLHHFIKRFEGKEGIDQEMIIDLKNKYKLGKEFVNNLEKEVKSTNSIKEFLINIFPKVSPDSDSTPKIILKPFLQNVISQKHKLLQIEDNWCRNLCFDTSLSEILQ